jgi:hypothetical protein
MNTLAIPFAVFAVLMLIGCDRPAGESTGGGPSGDPLAYTVQKGDGVTLASFDGWEATATADQQAMRIVSHPRGRQDDFALVTLLSPIGEAEQANFLDASPAEILRAIPGLTPRGEPRPATFGGDAARLIEYDVAPDAAAGPRSARGAFVRKGDMGVIVLAVGSDAAMRELGRAVEIVAGSVSFTESPLDPALVGTWYNAGSMSSGSGAGLFSVTWEKTTAINPDGTFREWDTTLGSGNTGSLSSDGARYGRIVRRGETLTFHYADGSVRGSDYSLQGNVLRLFGQRWTPK